jgi:hypothetical protein
MSQRERLECEAVGTAGMDVRRGTLPVYADRQCGEGRLEGTTAAEGTLEAEEVPD